MKTRSITVQEADELSRRPEDHFFDRKAFAVSGRKLQKIVVGFANADGGEIVVGIADDNDKPLVERRWDGAATVEDFNAHLQAVFSLGPAVDVRYEFLECHGRPGLTL